MANVLTFPNGSVSSCSTLNAPEAQRKKLINWLSSLFFEKTWTSTTSSFFVDVVEVNKSLPKLETSISVPTDSVNKHNVSEFL